METARTYRASEEVEQARKNHSVLLLRDGLISDGTTSEEFYRQVYDLETTLFSESLAGENRTEFKFEVHDGRLYVLQPNGTNDWLALHRNGLTRAHAKSWEDSRFGFYAKIAEAELAEAECQQELVKTGEPATLFAMSLCGDDVASDDVLEILGRDPKKKRGYIRASVFDGQKMHLYSCSMDGLAIEDAQTIYRKFFNVELPPGTSSMDVLQNLIHLPGAQHDLLDRISPRKDVEKETQQFVLGQHDLLQAHMEALRSLAAKNMPPHVLEEDVDNLRYDIMASLKHRYEGNWTDVGGLASSVANAGSVERGAGTQFYGCDTIITISSLTKTGYQNANQIEHLLGRKEFESEYCPCCLPKPKAGKKVKAWREGDRIGCGSCGHVIDICTKKVIKPGKQKATTTKFWAW